MKIHFIGIGGIGVSALAQYYLVNGHEVSGSDLAVSEITEMLKRKGAKLLIGQHKSENVPKDADTVIYSAAVPCDNVELKEAKKLGIKCQSYPEALGELTKKYFTIAVCGTHGKSTTAAMLSLILIKAGLDPTVIIGTKLKEFNNSNFRIGKIQSQNSGPQPLLVIEADEWQASFLNYWPKMIALTNIEKEHLDYYKNLHHIVKTYKEFIGHLPKNGVLIANKDDKRVYRMAENIKTEKHKNKKTNEKPKIIYYSLEQKESGKLKKVLKITGEHNISNALAAFSAVRYGIRYSLGREIPKKTIEQALSQYKGSWRRFEIKQSIINNQQLTIVHDYAHHPTEIMATLSAAREKWPKKEIWAVFQPHQYQRTYYLFNDFARVFKQALIGKLQLCRLIITDIYDVAGRETKKIKQKVSAKKLVSAIASNKAVYLKKQEILPYLVKNTKGRGVVVIFMGAGDIYELV